MMRIQIFCPGMFLPACLVLSCPCSNLPAQLRYDSPPQGVTHRPLNYFTASPSVGCCQHVVLDGHVTITRGEKDIKNKINNSTICNLKEETVTHFGKVFLPTRYSLVFIIGFISVWPVCVCVCVCVCVSE